MLEAPNDVDGPPPTRDFDTRRSCRVKVVSFEGGLAAVEAVVGMHPSVARSIGASVLTGDRDARRSFTAALIKHDDFETSHRHQVLSALDHELVLGTTERLLDPQGGVPAAIRNESDLLAIRRPARIDVVEVSIRKRKRIATLSGHHPQLVPSLADVGRIDNALAVGRESWSCFPGSFFVMNLARLRSRLRLHPPKATGSVEMATIRNVQQFLPIGRPCRADLVIEPAVVITRERTAVLACESLHIGKSPCFKAAGKNMEAAIVGGRDKGNSLAVGRKARLDVYSSCIGQRVNLPALQIEHPQLHRT